MSKIDKLPARLKIIDAALVADKILIEDFAGSFTLIS
jgi:hypothetical protein